jgi:hypothetical protein
MKFMDGSGRIAAFIGGLIVLMGSVSAWPQAARPDDPLAPGDVVLRDLDVPVLTSAGHSGVFLGPDARTGVPLVLEALNVEMNPREERNAITGEILGLPDYIAITRQALHISPLDDEVDPDTGRVIRPGFRRAGLRYYGARAGLSVRLRGGGTKAVLANRQEAARLADLARQQMQYGSKYEAWPIHTRGYYWTRCVKHSGGVFNTRCIESQRYKRAGTFRCDTLIAGFYIDLYQSVVGWRGNPGQFGLLTPSKLFALYRVVRPRVDPAEFVTR